MNWLCPAKTCGVTYEAEGAVVEVEIDGHKQQLRTKLVVGADGVRSRLRHWAGMKTTGWNYWRSLNLAQVSGQTKPD